MSDLPFDPLAHPWTYRAFEPGRAMVELGALALVAPAQLRHRTTASNPVVVVSGLSGGNGWTGVLRTYLTRTGHDVHAPEVNLGSPRNVVRALVRQIDELHERSGATVSLVGWSVGGAYVRQAVTSRHKKVRLVITLGTPLTGWWYPSELKHAGQRLRVPTTAIYSRTDGIIDWRRQVQRAGPTAENVEVVSSHLGMASNPLVFAVITDRLEQPEGQWRPFRWTSMLR